MLVLKARSAMTLALTIPVGPLLLATARPPTFTRATPTLSILGRTAMQASTRAFGPSRLAGGIPALVSTAPASTTMAMAALTGRAAAHFALTLLPLRGRSLSPAARTL